MLSHTMLLCKLKKACYRRRRRHPNPPSEGAMFCIALLHVSSHHNAGC